VFLHHGRRQHVQLQNTIGRKSVLPVAHRAFNFAAIYQSSSNHSRFFALQKSEQPGQQETSTNTTCKARNEHQHHLRPKGSNFWLCVLIGSTGLFMLSYIYLHIPHLLIVVSLQFIDFIVAYYMVSLSLYFHTGSHMDSFAWCVGSSQYQVQRHVKILHIYFAQESVLCTLPALIMRKQVPSYLSNSL
jgi:hypothetical protein